MQSIVLYCCTYSKDLARVCRLAQSVARFNRDGIAFYISVPAKDMDLFRSHLPAGVCQLIAEEDIVKCNPRIDFDKLYQLRGVVQQQIIKSEFWRLGLAKNYLVLDSDCVFIRNFGRSDFLADGDVPYSIVHEGRGFLQATRRFGPKRARKEYLNDRKPIMDEFGRTGVVYDYGYAPFLWSAQVWKDLDEKFLIPRGWSFLDAVIAHPSEFTWYGEALMHFRSIPLWPREELFRHYHHEHQYWLDRLLGYAPGVLAEDYMGLVMQSNWQTWEDFGSPEKSALSRFARSIRRYMRVLRFYTRLVFRR